MTRLPPADSTNRIRRVLKLPHGASPQSGLHLPYIPFCRSLINSDSFLLYVALCETSLSVSSLDELGPKYKGPRNRRDQFRDGTFGQLVRETEREWRKVEEAHLWHAALVPGNA